jgi:non-specific protein-tyrosine kinase
VRTSGVEDVKAALRRNAWAIVLLVLLGAGAMTLFKQMQGPNYSATATVVLAPADIASSLTGIQPAYVDPGRADAAERDIAAAPQLFDRAAQESNRDFGSAQAMRSATAVSVDNKRVTFTSDASSSGVAAGIANATANAYPRWRASVFASSIQIAIGQLRARLRTGGKNAALSDQLQKLELLNTVNSSGVLFVEPAHGAVQTTPRLKRDAIVGGVIGLLIALLLVGAREVLDTRVRSDSDVEEALGVPVLATVASLPRRARAHVHSLGQSKHADTYELLAANLVQLLGENGETQTIAVTSAVAGEGKTTTAVHLAAALARRGMRVVIADFDLRRPTLARLFAIDENVPGVSDVLEGTVRLPSALWWMPMSAEDTIDGAAVASLARARGRTTKPVATQVTSEGSLIVLPAGQPLATGRTGSLFSRLPDLLEELSTKADIVLLDTPPALLAAGVAELSRRVDGLLVVVRQGVTPKRKLRSLARQANTWHANIVGAVLNDSAREVGYGYYYARRN